MKKLILISILFAANLLAMGTARQYLTNAAPAVVTNVFSTPTGPVEGPAQAPASAPASSLVASGSFLRPSVAVAPDGGLWVAAEGPGMKPVFLFGPDGKGCHTGGLVVQAKVGGPVDASRAYTPDMVVDRDGVLYLAVRLGTKEGGKMHGPGTFIRQPDGSGAFHFQGFSTGTARLALEKGRSGCILMSKDGAWICIDRMGRTVRAGRWPAGSTGEKLAFSIEGGTWWSAHCGYSKESSAVAFGLPASGKRITWADYAAYPEQGSDLCWSSVAAHGATGYVAAAYGGRLRLQVVERGACRFPTSKLADLGPATGEDRCPPRLVRTASGVVAVWSDKGAVMAVRVDAFLAGRAKPVRIGTGSMPAACALQDGRIAVATVGAGVLRLVRVSVP